jgi:DNA-binding response OmpR family regulator
VLHEIRDSNGDVGRYDPNLPVIVLSGRATPTDRLRGLTERADDYVAKPSRYSRSRRIAVRRD